MPEERITKENIAIAADNWKNDLSLAKDLLLSCGLMRFLEIILTTSPTDWSYLDVNGIDVVQTEYGVVYNKNNIC